MVLIKTKGFFFIHTYLEVQFTGLRFIYYSHLSYPKNLNERPTYTFPLFHPTVSVLTEEGFIGSFYRVVEVQHPLLIPVPLIKD